MKICPTTDDKMAAAVADVAASSTSGSVLLRFAWNYTVKALNSSSHDHMDGSCESRPSIDRGRANLNTLLPPSPSLK